MKDPLQLLRQVLEVLQFSLDLEEISYAVLSALTSGESFGFNRAFLVLRAGDSNRFYGFFGMGPATPEEAQRIWREIEEKGLTLRDLVRGFSKERFREEKERFRHILQQMTFSPDTPGFWEIFQKGEAILVRGEPPNLFLKRLSEILGTREFVVLPIATREGPIGFIVADNFVTGAPITPEAVEMLKLFGGEAGVAIARARLYYELQNKLEELNRAHRTLRAYQEALSRIEKMAFVGKLVHHIAHELKNPLVVIGGLAGALLKETPPEDPNRPYLQAIHEESQRLIHTLNRILDELRERYVLKREVLNLNRVVELKLEEMKPFLEKQEIRVELNLQPDLPPVWVNFDQISACIESLITNAVEAMGAGGTLSIRTYEEGEWVVLTIRDTGPGIPEELGEKVYEPFYTTKPEGSGLGLYNCRQAMEAHGGQIFHENAPGGGTTFYLKLKKAPQGGSDGQTSVRR